MSRIEELCRRILPVLAMGYTDRCDILRERREGNQVVREKAAEGIPCRLSVGYLPQLVQTEGAASVRGRYTLYCDPDVDLREGDFLEITHRGRVYCCGAGMVFVYPLNRVCRLEIGEVA